MTLSRRSTSSRTRRAVDLPLGECAGEERHSGLAKDAGPGAAALCVGPPQLVSNYTVTEWQLQPSDFAALTVAVAACQGPALHHIRRGLSSLWRTSWKGRARRPRSPRNQRFLMRQISPAPSPMLACQSARSCSTRRSAGCCRRGARWRLVVAAWRNRRARPAEAAAAASAKKRNRDAAAAAAEGNKNKKRCKNKDEDMKPGAHG